MNGEVVGAQRAGRADLRGLLAEQRRPEAELALALEGHRLGIDAADDRHVAIEVAQLERIDVGDEVPVGAADGALPVDGDQLDQAVVARPGGEPLGRNLELRNGHLDSPPVAC